MHDNHRERMRERYLQSGFDGFATHELLEMLLYYSIPRGDTNETAHLLIEHFGCLDRLFEASVDELKQISGIGTNSAILLKLITELSRRYVMEETAPRASFDSVSKVAQFFNSRFFGTDHEVLYMMMLDNGMKMMDCRVISSGTVNSSAAPIRKMAETAMWKKAPAVILAHNHPHGLAIPSTNDLDFTDEVYHALDLLGITLVEHIIIAEDRFCPVLKQRYGMLRKSPISGNVESGFYDAFYDVDEETWTLSRVGKKG